MVNTISYKQLAHLVQSKLLPLYLTSQDESGESRVEPLAYMRTILGEKLYISTPLVRRKFYNYAVETCRSKLSLYKSNNSMRNELEDYWRILNISLVHFAHKDSDTHFGIDELPVDLPGAFRRLTGKDYPLPSENFHHSPAYLSANRHLEQLLTT